MGVLTPLFTTLFLFTLLVGGVSAQASSLDDQLRQRERALAVALQANDRTTLEELIDAAFVMRGYPDIARDQWMDRANELCWGKTFEIDDFLVREDVGAVMTTFVMTFDQDPVTCQPATLRSLITDLWVRRGTEWKLLVRHSSGVTEAGSAANLQQQFATVPPPDPVWQLDAELSMVATSGNTATQTIGTTADLEHDTGAWNTTARGAFVRSRADGLESARSLLLEVRPGRELTSRLTLFARGGFRRDLFAGIEGRIAGGAGLSYEAIAVGSHELEVEGGIGFERERRLQARRRRIAATQTRTTYRWRVAPTFLLGDEAGVSIDLNNAGNWRGSNKASLTVAMTRVLSVKLSHTLEFVNEPVPGFRKLDTITSAGLVVNLER